MNTKGCLLFIGRVLALSAILALHATGGEPKPAPELVPDVALDPADAAAIRSLFHRLSDGFISGDHEAVKKLVKASAEERERVAAALGREFRQARYIEFTVLDVAPDELLKDRRQTVDVRLRYKLVHREMTPTTPVGHLLELASADSDSDGHWLEVPLQAPSHGRYEVLIATADARAWTPPHRLSPFAWTIDGAPEQNWTSSPEIVADEDLQLLGTLELKEGAHTFKLRLTDRRESPDTQYAFWIDAVVLRRKIAPPETNRTPLVFEAESGRWSSAWDATPYIENRVTQTFAVQKLDDGSFMLIGSEFFDTLGLRQGLGGVMVNAVFAVMIAGACLIFWVWMGYEAYRVRPRLTFWRIVVLLPVVGPLAFFIFGYLPRLLRGLVTATA